MKKTSTLAAIVAMMAIAPALATVTETDRKTPTSKGYVDTAIDTRQARIPAANTNSATPGTTVVTYTGTAGTIGERGIYDNSNNYTAGTDAGKLVTAGALTNKVATLPTIQTSKLTCANDPDCTLWTIEGQTVNGPTQQQQGN